MPGQMSPPLARILQPHRSLKVAEQAELSRCPRSHSGTDVPSLACILQHPWFVESGGGATQMITALVPLFVPATGMRRPPAHTALPESAVAEEWLRLGTRAACEGNREDARYYFAQAVRSDLDNARAWLYLGGVADDPA